MSKESTHSTSFIARPALLTAVLLLVGLGVVAGFYWQQSLRVDTLRVSGIWFNQEADILEAAQVPMGIAPDSLNLEELKNRVMRLAYVKSVHPYIEPGGTLHLSIEERIPIALLVGGDVERYTDAEGVQLPVLTGKTVDVPLVYGFSSNRQTDTLKTTDFIQLARFLEEAKEHKFAWATLSEVAFDPKEGVVALSHENGVKLLFGTDSFTNKLANWELFYTQVIRETGIARIAQIDLRFNDQIITRES
jgi:cell division septal protein FtsQ